MQLSEMHGWLRVNKNKDLDRKTMLIIWKR